MNSFPSSPLFSLSLRGERWKSSIPSRSATQRNKVKQIDVEARLFWRSIVKTKHPSLTSLAFMQLGPGDDRGVRHICIRCIYRHFCSSNSSTASLVILLSIVVDTGNDLASLDSNPGRSGLESALSGGETLNLFSRLLDSKLDKKFSEFKRGL